MVAPKDMRTSLFSAMRASGKTKYYNPCGITIHEKGVQKVIAAIDQAPKCFRDLYFANKDALNTAPNGSPKTLTTLTKKRTHANVDCGGFSAKRHCNISILESDAVCGLSELSQRVTLV
jgi:hypothetical protein